MKKLFVSVGLIAAGTAGLQAAYAPDLSPMSASKIWSVEGTLRGFYDNNYTTAPSSKGSFGFEVSPQVDLNVALQQTELGMRYAYGMYFYQERASLAGQNPIDQTHELDFWVDHAFTERWQGKVQDSFVVGQEPELLDPNTSVPTRIEGNNIRNTGTLTLDTIWTRLLSTQLSYGNTVFDYQNNNGTAALPSRAGLLNRVEQTISLDLQWAISPQTMAFVGGELGWVNYTADEPIANGPTGPLFSDARDNRSYIAYVGAQHTFFANLNFTGKVGIQYTDAYNALSGGTSLNPYADLSLIYTYLPGSYVQAGFTQSENTSDVADPNASGQTTLFTESSTIYLSLNQKLTSKIMGSGIARWQHSVYNGGAFDNKADDYYSFGVNLSYTFNPHFSAEAGYNFDDVQSQVGNQYTRSRVYLGVTAAY